MTKKEFDKKVNAICKKHNCKKEKNNTSFKFDSFMGEVYVNIEYSPRIKFCSLFMRFLDSSKFNLDIFKKVVLNGCDNFNTHSFKLNIHNTDVNFVLNELDERIDNLIWLSEKSNLNKVLKNLN